MKNVLLNSITKLSWLVLLAMIGFSFSSCEEDEDGNGNGDDEIVLDGFYIKGAGTAFTDLSSDAQMSVTKNEVNQEERSTLYEMYITVKGGSDGFNIVEVAGDQQLTYGPADDFAVVPEEDRIGDEPQVDFQRGSYTETDNQFTVDEDGLYHVAIDTEVGKAVVVPVKYWGLIGGATPGGWTDDTKLEPTGFDLNSITYEATGVEIASGEYKFRYSGGWKVELDSTLDLGGGNTGVRINTNFGGSASALNPGGDNIVNEDAGVYTATMQWSLEDGYSATMNKTEDIVEPEYPDSLYMIGNALSMDDSDGDGTPDGWQWDLTDKPMVPTHSHPYLFWKIVWLESEGEFKFAPQREWSGDFGGDGSGVTDGEIAKGTENITVPGESGYYMVVVDLENEMIAVSDTPMVYLLGETTAEGDDNDVWSVDENFEFTVDNSNEVLTLTKDLYPGNIRLTAYHSWFDTYDPVVEWWQTEFIIIDGEIVFRGTGEDQERVTIDAAGNYTIDLNFDAGTGSVTAQ